MTRHAIPLPELNSPALRDQFNEAQPFRHVVLDNAFDDTILDEVLGEFPGPRDIDWIRFKNRLEIKLGSRDPSQLGVNTRELIDALNSPAFLASLETLTGIDNLVADPTLSGGGLHQIEKGGRLEIHADFNRHEEFGSYRRLNLLLYLNRDWREDYGGHLELWNADMSACEQRILPVYNRCVIFETSDNSYHGHPEKLRCPRRMTRKSIALYYYTEAAPDIAEDSQPHSTLFQQRPGAAW